MISREDRNAPIPFIDIIFLSLHSCPKLFMVTGPLDRVMTLSGDDKGVSPILAILMMIAITLVLAGVILLISSHFINYGSDTVEIFLFNVEAKGSADTINVEIMKGSLNTSRMDVMLEGASLNITSTEIRAGETLRIPAGIDIVPGTSYDVTIIVDNKVMYQNTVNAGT
jgi:flagellin-like protein